MSAPAVDRRGRILVVDDSLLNRQTLGRLLGGLGHERARGRERPDRAGPPGRRRRRGRRRPARPRDARARRVRVARRHRGDPALARDPRHRHVRRRRPRQRRPLHRDGRRRLPPAADQPDILLRARVNTSLADKRLRDDNARLAGDRRAPARGAVAGSSRRRSPRSSRPRRASSCWPATAAQSPSRVLRPPRLHRLHRDRRARGAPRRPARVPRGDGRADRRARRARSSTSPATGCIVVLQRPDPPGGPRSCAPSGWPSRCASGSPSSPPGGRKRGYALGFGVGIADGFATLGRIGFEGRYDYAAIGNAVILAARLSGQAAPGQILLAPARLRRRRGRGRRRGGRRPPAQGRQPPGLGVEHPRHAGRRLTACLPAPR